MEYLWSQAGATSGNRSLEQRASSRVRRHNRDGGYPPIRVDGRRAALAFYATRAPQRYRRPSSDSASSNGLCSCCLPGPRRCTTGLAQTVERTLPGLTDEATAETDRVLVGDPALLECSSESGLVELRVVTRTREAPNIDERDDAGVANDGREFVDGPSPVADRPDDHQIRMPTSPIFRGSDRGVRRQFAPS
jgi:hypothetical protein